MRSNCDTWRENGPLKDKEMMKKCETLFKRIHNNIRYLFFYVVSFLMRDKYLFIRAWVEIERGLCLHRNWGDELNENIIKYLTKRKAVFLPSCALGRFIHIKSYLLVGSIITSFSLTHTIVWGSGIINDNKMEKLCGTPDKICAVRGPKTRYELEKKGIQCPEVYGDPALLMPRFYQPSMQKRYSMGIIPHYIDLKKDDVVRLCNDSRVKLIKVQGYKEWTDFIDEICSCDIIISSSLHGLIVAEAYGIPSLWVEFGTYVDGWEFKYYDFYESIGKVNESPLHVSEKTTYEILISKKAEWRRGFIDLDKLMEACPIK